MTMNFSLWEAAANARRLVDDLSYPESIRAMAGDVADLASLLETWPVPRSLNLNLDLKRQMLGLCQLSGIALCGIQRCVAAEGMASNSTCGIT